MKERDLSAEDFQQLLNWLGPDRQRAGEKYESIRRALTELFENWSCDEADNLADETINRVLSKVRSVAPTYSGDPALYFYGTAKRVRYEYLRRPRPAPLIVDIRAVSPEDVEEKEQLHACLDGCLNVMPATDREVILEYYRGDKKTKIAYRRYLGEQAGVSRNALRVRVYRLRVILEECIGKCLQKVEKGNRSA